MRELSLVPDAHRSGPGLRVRVRVNSNVKMSELGTFLHTLIQMGFVNGWEVEIEKIGLEGYGHLKNPWTMQFNVRPHSVPFTSSDKMWDDLKQLVERFGPPDVGYGPTDVGPILTDHEIRSIE